jgi:small-conductance mechanosensitive channel
VSDRIRVTEAELRDRWFSDAAAGMIHDHQTREKVVRMDDGTEYATPFSELTREGDDA